MIIYVFQTNKAYANHCKYIVWAKWHIVSPDWLLVEQLIQAINNKNIKHVHNRLFVMEIHRSPTFLMDGWLHASQ